MKKNVRKQGILLPISSIPSAYGIGTFGKESYRFVDFLEKSGNHLWQILPLGPTGYGDSPYQSFSTFAGNPYYIDLELLIEDGYLTKEIWKYPPFCYSNPEKELRRIDILFDDNALSKIRTPNSEFQQEFLIFCAAITRIPMAILHFIAAGRFFELDYLRRLKKRNETYFAMAAHDCFSSKEFWDELRELQSWDRDIEPFSVYPELTSTYVFARSPKNEKEMVFVERVIFPRLIDFYTYDLMNGLHHGHAPSQCQGCGRYFLTTNGHIPKYCDGVAPQDDRYTCRQYGAMMHQKEQNKQHPVYRLFNTRTDTIRKHHQRGNNISDDLRREALYLAGSYRDKALMDNDYAADGYARDMELEHLYAEAEKRLK